MQVDRAAGPTGAGAASGSAAGGQAQAQGGPAGTSPWLFVGLGLIALVLIGGTMMLRRR